MNFFGIRLLFLLISLHGFCSLSLSCSSLSAGTLESPLSFTMPDVCYGVLDYTMFDTMGTCTNYTIAQAQTFPNLWSFMTPECRPYLASYMCGLSFPKCRLDLTVASNSSSSSSSSAGLPCIEDCTSFRSKCTSNPIDAYMLNALAPQYLKSCDSMGLQKRASNMCVSVTASIIQPLSSSSSSSSPPAVRVPRCEIYNRSACSGVSAGQSVYIPAGLAGLDDPMGFIEKGLLLTKSAWSLGPTVGDCPTAMAQWMCSQALLGCESFYSSPLGTAGPFTVFPKLPCRSVCDRYANSTCQSLFSQLPASLVPNCETNGNVIPISPSSQCDGSLEQPPQPDWPVSQSSFGFLTTSCNSMERSYKPYANVDCPFPLVIPDDPNSPNRIEGGPCATPCPLLLVSDDSYSSADLLMRVIGTFSLLGSAFLVATWVTFKKKRQQTILLMFTITTFFASFLVTVHNILPGKIEGLGHGPHLAGLGCKNNADQSDGGYCYAYAFVQIINAGALITWWCLLSVDLYSKVALNIRPSSSSPEHRLKMRIIVIIGFVYPISMAIMSAAFNIIGDADGTSWCSIHTRNPNWPEAGWGTFYFPVLFLLLVGTYCTSHTIFVLWQSTRSVSTSHSSHHRPSSKQNNRRQSASPSGNSSSSPRSSQSSPANSATNASSPGLKIPVPSLNLSSSAVTSTTSKKYNKGGWKKYVRVLLFIFVFWILYGFIFAYRAYVYFNQNSWLASAADMIRCLLVTGPTYTALTGVPYLDCPTTPTNSTNLPLWYCIHFSFAGQGFLNFLLYGTMKENFQLWGNLLSRNFVCCSRLINVNSDGMSKNKSSTAQHETIVQTQNQQQQQKQKHQLQQHHQQQKSHRQSSSIASGSIASGHGRRSLLNGITNQNNNNNNNNNNKNNNKQSKQNNNHNNNNIHDKDDSKLHDTVSEVAMSPQAQSTTQLRPVPSPLSSSSSASSDVIELASHNSFRMIVRIHSDDCDDV